MLGSRLLFIPGIVILTLGLTLEAGTTGAVKVIKMSTKLVTSPASSHRVQSQPKAPADQLSNGDPVGPC
jgi:hypothetical protein